MKNFDINLLRILNVLLEEQSVTATAARLHLSQSAVSKQLAKLRQTFADPLFERTPYGQRRKRFHCLILFMTFYNKLIN